MTGGWTPAHCAAEEGRLNSLHVLHEHGAALCLTENTGDTPRRIAEIYGHTECVEFLKRYLLLNHMQTIRNGLQTQAKTLMSLMIHP